MYHKSNQDQRRTWDQRWNLLKIKVLETWWSKISARVCLYSNIEIIIIECRVLPCESVILLHLVLYTQTSHILEIQSLLLAFVLIRGNFQSLFCVHYILAFLYPQEMTWIFSGPAYHDQGFFGFGIIFDILEGFEMSSISQSQLCPLNYAKMNMLFRYCPLVLHSTWHQIYRC